jgi:hypothetical protein
VNAAALPFIKETNPQQVYVEDTVRLADVRSLIRMAPTLLLFG